VTGARTTLLDGLRDHLTAEYNSITGEERAFHNSGDLRDAVAQYVQSYASWSEFRRSLSWRYGPITELNSLLKALAPDMP